MFATQSPAPLIGAHRGASGEAPENTIAAFDLAIAQGAELLECDVHRTADGALVIHHDFDLSRTAGRGGRIAALTLEDVRVADVGSWRGSSWAGAHIPTLQEVLDRYVATTFLNVEIKVGTHYLPILEEQVVAALREAGALPRVVISAFDAAVIQRVRELEPHLLTGLLEDEDPDEAIATAVSLGATAVHLEAGLATAVRVVRAHSLGLKVLVWTIDDPVEMVRVVDLGVDAVLSNYPDRLAAVVRARRH